MDDKLKDMLEKAKAAAAMAGDAAGKGIDAASKKTGELAAAAKLRKQLFDLNVQRETLLKELGRLVYDTHRGIEVLPEELDERLSELDEKEATIAALTQELEESKPGKKCPNCGASCGKTDLFCKTCGTAL